jgi:hypothetical protein
MAYVYLGDDAAALQQYRALELLNDKVAGQIRNMIFK